MKILTKKSKTYPKDNIMSYGVTIIKKDTIKKNDNEYTYDAYYFNSLNEYNDWKLKEQNKYDIEELKNRLNRLEVDSPLAEQVSNTKDNVDAITMTMLELMNEVYSE